MFPFFPICLQEEEAGTCDGNDGSNDLEGGNAGLVEHLAGQEDEDGGERHEGLRYACRGHLDGHEGEADADEGTEDDGSHACKEGLAVVDNLGQLVELAGVGHCQGEGDEAHDGTHHGGGEGNERGGCLVGGWNKFGVVGHAHLAENESDALSGSGSDAQKDAAQGELEVDALLVTSGQDAHADATHADEHAQEGRPRECLAQQYPGCQGGKGGGEGHEQLPEAAADDDVGIEKAVVAQHVAHEAGEREPHPGCLVGIEWEGAACEYPQGGAEQDEGGYHACYVHGELTYTLGGDFSKECSCRPRYGNDK